MLLLLSLLGVTAMQVSMLQERMSGNFRAQQVAFERAEGRMAEGRDNVSNPLYAYDYISPVPARLVAGDTLPWDSLVDHLSSRPEFDQKVRACGGACPEQRGSIVADDPNKKPRFYIVSGQEKDPSSRIRKPQRGQPCRPSTYFEPLPGRENPNETVQHQSGRDARTALRRGGHRPS